MREFCGEVYVYETQKQYLKLEGVKQFKIETKGYKHKLEILKELYKGIDA
jgi:hypothetical protein